MSKIDHARNVVSKVFRMGDKQFTCGNLGTVTCIGIDEVRRESSVRLSRQEIQTLLLGLEVLGIIESDPLTNPTYYSLARQYQEGERIINLDRILNPNVLLE